jgi:outer membrane murein-binding lipoprotein Lpp
MRNRFETRTLVLAAVALALAVVAFVVVAGRGSATDHLSSSVDHAAARADDVESSLEALRAAIPTTTTPPPTFLPTTTSSTILVNIPAPTTTTTAPPSVVLTAATRPEIEAIVTRGVWDFALPLPSEGIAQAAFEPATNGGRLAYTTSAPAADTATFFRGSLLSKGFVFTEEPAGEQYTFNLGGQGSIVVKPTGPSTSTISVTISL